MREIEQRYWRFAFPLPEYAEGKAPPSIAAEEDRRRAVCRAAEMEAAQRDLDLRKETLGRMTTLVLYVPEDDSERGSERGDLAFGKAVAARSGYNLYAASGGGHSIYARLFCGGEAGALVRSYAPPLPTRMEISQ